MTDQELKQIAVDMYDGNVFTNLHIEYQSMTPVIFMPIALGAFSKYTKEELKKIGLIYEYLDKSGPRSINGMPTFLSFKTLTIEDTEKMLEFYKEYETLKKSYLK